MQTDRGTARVVGVLFVVATAAAVVGDYLARPIRDEKDYLSTFSSHETRVIISMLSELVLAAAVIGIAAMLFPLLKREHEGLAMGYLGARIVEGAIIVLGGISSLLLLTLSRDFLSQGGPTPPPSNPPARCSSRRASGPMLSVQPRCSASAR